MSREAKTSDAKANRGKSIKPKDTLESNTSSRPESSLVIL